MNSLELFNPVRIIFGADEVKNTGKEAKKIGKKALIITGKSACKKHGFLEKATKSLTEAGLEFEVFSGVSPNPKDNEVDAAAALGKEKGCDFIIGLGGGSAMDAAKGAAVVAAGGGKLWDYIPIPGKDAKPVEKALPIMMIPTVAATSSESNPNAVFTKKETNQKTALIEPGHLFPKISIVDPALTVTLPEKPTFEGVVDVMMHVLEQYLTGDPGCDVQDRFIEGITLTCIENAYRLKKDLSDIRARENISLSSTLGIHGLPQAGIGGTWVVHPMEHSVSGYYDDVAHGAGIAAILPAYLDFLKEEQPDKAVQLGKRVFGADENCSTEEGIEACKKGFKKLFADLGLKDNLKDLGVKEEDLEKLRDKTIELAGMPHPKLDEDKMLEIFKNAYNGV